VIDLHERLRATGQVGLLLANMLAPRRTEPAGAGWPDLFASAYDESFLL
jgi:hypothetical protein